MKAKNMHSQRSSLLRAGLLALVLILLGLACAMLLSLPLSSHAQSGTGTIRVAITGSDGAGCGSEAAPCRTVQYAVDQALAGDEILVATGVYTNANMAAEGYFLVLDKELTLSGGFSPGNWTVSDPQTYPTAFDAEDLGSVVSAHTPGITITLNGLSLERGSTFGVDLRYARLLMSHCTVSDTTNYGIYLDHSEGSRIQQWLRSSFRAD